MDYNKGRPVRTAGQALGGWAGRTPHDFQPMVWPQGGKHVRPAGPQRLDQQRPLPDGKSRAHGPKLITPPPASLLPAATRLPNAVPLSTRPPRSRLPSNLFARDHGTGSLYGHDRQAFMRKIKSSGRTNSARCGPARRPGILCRHQPGFTRRPRLTRPIPARPASSCPAQKKFDLRPVGQYGVLFTGRIQFSLERRAWRNANGATGFAGQSLPRYAQPKIPALVPTKGGEIGVRTVAVPHLQSTLSLWYLHSNSELQQDGDTGGTSASEQPSNRYGVEWANYYTPAEHLAFDFDIADSRAQFTEIDPDDAAYASVEWRSLCKARVASLCLKRSRW